MEWSTDRGLQARMVATLGLVAVVAAAGAVVAYATVLAGLWAGAALAGATLSAGAAHLSALVISSVLLAGIAVSELWLDRSLGLPEVDAHSADREFHPGLAAHVDRIARQLDLPRPTVALTEDPVPLAMTTGLTPGSATLVVSTGLLEALDEDELEAVVAHELAHVRNRDAAVTTLAALPMVIADAVREWAAVDAVEEEGADVVYEWERVEDDDGEAVPTYQLEAAASANDGRERHEGREEGPGLLGFVYLAAVPFWFAGRLSLSLLSRHRELAADRAAAAITGSPAALASALRTLTEADRPPARDRRTRHAVDAFAIVPEDPPEPVRLGPDGEREQTFAGLTRWVDRVSRTHPDLDRRLAVLRELQADVETRDTG